MESLSITHVVSLGKEIFSQNGIHKTVECIVKNHPLEVHLKLQQKNISFAKVGIDATLLYDTEAMKPVDYVRDRPLSVKTRVLKDPTEAVVVCTIRVLSSQHEDMFFRIRFTCVDRETGNEVSAITTLSPSIKVISKVEQFNKPDERQKRKRSSNQDIVDQLARIEKHQTEQRHLLENILNGVSNSLVPNPPPILEKDPVKKEVSSPLVLFPDGSPQLTQFSAFFSGLGSDLLNPKSPVDTDKMVQLHLEGLLSALQCVSEVERPKKIRRVLATLSPCQVDLARETGEYLRESSSEADSYLLDSDDSEGFFWPSSSVCYPPYP